MNDKTETLDAALELALKLSPVDKVRLLERVASTLEYEMTQTKPETDVAADFRAAWHEAMTDQTHPVSALWDDIDDK
jgi:hypothetical protein